MELNSFNAKFTMPKAHDRAVVGFGGYFELARQRFPLDDQRMIARGGKGIGELAEDALGIVVNLAGLAMKQLGRTNDLSSEGGADGLMPKANAENRALAG